MFFDYIKKKYQTYSTYLMREQRARLIFDMNSIFLKNKALSSFNERGTTSLRYIKDKLVIVSLTSYGKRLHEVYLTIESLMQQTCPANRIILWLSKDVNKSDIPQILISQMQRGLEIKYCEDIRSYKKLIPCLKNFPNDVIITVDDDVIYEIDTIELLLQTYYKHPTCICSHWARDMVLNGDNKIKKYHEWNNYSTTEAPSTKKFPIGCAGILYPPQSLDKEVFNKDVFMDICPYADDVWFKAMSLKKGTKCVITPQHIHERQYYDNPQWQDKGLTLSNVKKNLNDKQIESVFSKYNLYNLI